MTTRKRSNKYKVNKRYSNKGRHTKEFLRMALELDYKIKKQHHWKMLWARNVFFPNLC